MLASRAISGDSAHSVRNGAASHQIGGFAHGDGGGDESGTEREAAGQLVPAPPGGSLGINRRGRRNWN